MSIAQQQQPQIVPAAPGWRRRFFAHPVTRIVTGMLFIMLATFGPLGLIGATVPKPLRPVWPWLVAAAMSVLAYRFLIRRTEKRPLTELSLPGAPREAAAGLALGAGLGLLIAGVLAVMGVFAVSGSNGWTTMFTSIPEQVMVACSEELIFRALLFRLVLERWGSRNALIVSFVMFALAHLPNDHVTVLGILVTGVAGVTLSACYLLTRRLWLSIGMHFGWNYLYDGLFAVPVSGHAARGWLAVSMQGPEWLTGGSYGVEASAVTLVAWTAAAIVLLRRVPKQGPLDVLAHQR